MKDVIDDKTAKASWGEGPWQQEPDHKEWKDPATGLPCLAHRNMSGGNWCGYVAVPPGHPMHGKGYNDVDVEVHGGLPYSNACLGPICHVPEPGEPDNVWWLGFDCAHYMDLRPGYRPMYEPDEGDTYRTLEYVEGECARLAAQIANQGEKT